ncbi:sensor histidine kinase [Sphingomonas japonica]|uniref:histidine kinase n=1 Tax=Sphingomonas japonica TaxID=511662 RepID=A0ABX0U3D7_9SPHN|nr:stimulus-sensing domain-containing protein [Sphingomonas japonica]NIJ25050.1 two-component system sensor histidine kinase ChvG [Sphingomonas japonica]
MVRAIASRTTDDGELPLRWTGRISLTPRILFVNIFALALLAGGFFYLDFYRTRIIDGRLIQASREARVIGQALLAMPRDGRDALLARLADTTGRWIRVYGPDGVLRIDTRALGVANFRLRDPDRDPWGQDAARFLDAAIDTVVGADRAPLYRERAADKGFDWPDVATARDTHTSPATVWRAPDRTPVITAASPLGAEGVVLTTINARDITQYVRVERYRLSIVLAVVSLVSVLLSLFLARTIVQPLRTLARAAVRVRRGRDREVVVPRLPSRRDEIGMLARALSDMSQALRARIDATEAFAADVTHELKNPLASLRSAVDTLSNVRDPALQERLLAVVHDDIHRLDRLITDISDASRLDAQLSRAKFEPVDLYAMVAALVSAREQRGMARGIRIVVDPLPGEGSCVILGEDARLERVIENLLDNAISFSPDGGLVTIAFERRGDSIAMHFEDEGPGVADDAREAIFRRFHSIRPHGEQFGKHSGLGLAIARTVVEGHQGAIRAESRRDGRTGAHFVVELPVSGG